MQVTRCPECGNRLNAGYCHMCMKQIPYASRKKEKSWQYRTYTPSRREEDHTCISFNAPGQKREGTNVVRSIGNAAQQRRNASKIKKPGLVAVVIAIIYMISMVAGFAEELFSDVDTSIPEPDYNYDQFIPAGEPGAESCPAVQPRTIYNATGITVTVDGAGDYYGDYAISFTVTNKSDRDVGVVTELLSVNGFMTPADALYMQVAGGETAKGYMQLSEYALEDQGIKEPAQIQFYLNIYDTVDYGLIGWTDLVTLDTDIAESYVQPVDDKGWEIYNQDGLRIVLQSMEMYSYGESSMSLYAENTSNRTVMLYEQEILVNGEESYGMFWTTLRPGTRSVQTVWFGEMQEQGIDDLSQIQEIAMDLHIEIAEAGSPGMQRVEETGFITLVFSPAELFTEEEAYAA